MTSDREQLRPGRIGAPLQLVCEQQIRELALPICEPFVVAALPFEIVEADLAHPMRAAADVDYPRSRRREQRVEQQSGERKMPEVIGAELHLESILGLAIRRRHHARVVDQRTQAAMRTMK